MKTSLRTCSLMLLICAISYNDAHAQLLDKIIKGAKQAKDAVIGTKQVAKEVSGATNEISNTVKTFKQSWKKDPSPNIKYEQIPDYRNRAEVDINKKQKLILENGEFRSIEWVPATYFDSQVFPSFIIGWASYKGTKEKDMGSSLGFDLNNKTAKALTLKWEIECNDKTYFNVDSGFISLSSNQSFRFMPKIDWDYKTLTRHQTSAPLNIRFRLIDPLNGTKVEKVSTITLRSINDCVRFYDGEDMRYMYAAYVNEDHPEIDHILKDALKTKMVDSFDGYQSGYKGVDLQIAAIWRVLNQR
eukprot:gene20800-24717_t